MIDQNTSFLYSYVPVSHSEGNDVHIVFVSILQKALVHFSSILLLRQHIPEYVHSLTSDNRHWPFSSFIRYMYILRCLVTLYNKQY